MERDQPTNQKKAGQMDASAAGKLGLEEIVHIANKVGLDYVDAKKKADHMSLIRPTVKARVMLRLDDGSTSESKLQRLAETDEETKSAPVSGEA